MIFNIKCIVLMKKRESIKLMDQKMNQLVGESKSLIDIIEAKSLELLNLYNDYSRINTVLGTTISVLRKESHEHEKLKCEMDELKMNLEVFIALIIFKLLLPHLHEYIDDENIKSKLIQNRLNFKIFNDAKFDVRHGYDAMTMSEKFYLNDFENAVDLFDK